MAKIDFSLDDVKPLLSAVGLGQDPTPAPKDVSQITPPPMPPGPPPPTPAVAGFKAWAGDPQNQQKIADGITAPGTPLLPSNIPAASPMGANVPVDPTSANAPIMPPQPNTAFLTPPTGMPNPTPNVGASTPAVTQRPLTMSEDQAANPDAYQRPMLKHAGVLGNILNFGAAGLIGAAGGIGNKDPLAGVNWVAQQAANDKAIPAENQAVYEARNVQPLKDAATLADTNSQTAQRNALANKADTTADDLTPFTLSPAQAAAINQPSLAGTQATMRDYNRLLGMAGNNNTSQANNTATNATKVTTNAATNSTKASNNAATNQTRESIADAANKTKALVASMHDSTSRANNANTNDHKGMAGGATAAAGGNFKVPADVTKRAALASNVRENADAIEDILKRRPDLVGAVGGRETNVEQLLGNNDPDISALGARVRNMALASNGAHGSKSFQLQAGTEKEILNSFHNGPQAVKGALDAQRGSMQTFLDDEKNFSSTGKRLGGITAPPTGGAPAEGATKTNSAGDKVVFKGGKWGPA